MPSQKSLLTHITSYTVLLVLFLLITGPVGAQTQTVLADQPTTEAKTAEPVAGPTGTKVATVSPDAAPTAKPDANSPEPKTRPSDAKADSPAATPVSAPSLPPQCQAANTIKADVVAMAQPIMLNRLGAALPGGMIFALKGDTVKSGMQVQLVPGKRPRPLVLRANVGDCLQITFTNEIPLDQFKITASPTPAPPAARINTPEVSLHVQGMEWATGSNDDGSFVGANNSSLVNAATSPTPSHTVYTLYAKAEGTFLLYTMGDTSSTGDQLGEGLFGALNVQPKGAEWYRSQVTADDMLLATYNANRPDQVPPGTLNCPPHASCTFNLNGKTVKVLKTPGGYLNTLDNHPLIKYDAVYPSKRANGTPVPPTLVGKPILKMLDANHNIVHSDLTAIITGPSAGRFPGANGDPNKPDPPCNAENNPALGGATVDPLFCQNPAAPDRKQPYREITVIYHGALGAIANQAFPVFNDSGISTTLLAGQDAFAINYGTGGIGAEVYANRIGVGPMGDCVDCKFEEFFLSAWSVGDPAMLVDVPANSNHLDTQSTFQPPCTTTADFNHPPCGGQRSSATTPYTMQPAVKAKVAFFPDDPSNVYHSYINDHVKFRILHGGRDVSHVHHQHAHQWLQSPNSDEGSYLDSQMISPGASYTLEMVYNGSGNRNKVVGDSIFHCHFYPHFAAGMWAMWRTHDVFESGTFVFPKSGQVVPGSRALPDGEIIAGTPGPAVVPLPTLPMAPLPAYVQVQHNVKVNGAQVTTGGQVVVGGTCQGNKINGLDVIGGCANGQALNGTVINSQFDGTQMTGQFQPSPDNQLENPGYPYFIPGIAGARAPHPPLDFAPDGPGKFLDGGLPRHIVTGGLIGVESHDQFDWSKDLAAMKAVQLPEDGTLVEKAAMAYFGKRCYPTFFPDGTAGSCPSSFSIPPQTTLNKPPTGFILNGLPRGPQSGAPFADPAVDDNGNPVGLKRTYKAAAIQMNVVFNKKGWHFPQQRMLTLWNDVSPTIARTRPPEPLFFRGNSGDIIEYWHTNLVPNYYLVDDFQVRTPTDILGQHIHLVKFDVTSSDGAGNGFNYEDGTFSPDEVREMIHAISNTAQGGSWQPLPGASPTLSPKPPPAVFGPAPSGQNWLGAQTTIQRWYLDPLVDDSGVDRTLRTVFTHDHFGPSTHQQAGLYAGLLVEPMGSRWTSNDGAQTFGSGPDGGPTSWQARILTSNPADSYREFALEFQDLQLAYAPVSIYNTTVPPITKPSDDPKKGWIDPAYAINAPAQSGTTATPNLISTGMDPTPPGTQSVNYLNEPLGYRVGQFADLSYAYDNSIQKTVNPLDSPDPMTPLMRAYQNDNVQVRVLVGAHVFAHQFNLEGPTWFAEPSWKNSGYRSVQAMGLSEHFELLFKVPSSSAHSTGRKCPDGTSDANCADYLYSPSLDVSGLSNGLWGFFRAYDPTKKANKLQPLPNNAVGSGVNVAYSTCPANAVKRVFNITAVTSQKALAFQNPFPGTILFNDRDKPSASNPAGNPLYNALGVMYVRTEDLVNNPNDPKNGTLKPGVPVEPLILRANAGDCIEVNLKNDIASNSSVFSQPFTWAPPFNAIPVQNKMSVNVGLHPQLLSYDGAQSDGINVGWNREGQKDQVVSFGNTITYQWYAGKVDRGPNGALTYTPVEFGSLNLFPSDPLFQHLNGLFGSMIIEPQGSTWKCGESGSLVNCDPSGGTSPTTRASATVTSANGATKFREFSLMISDDIRISSNPDGSTNSGAINYRTEPWKFRYTNNVTNDFSCFMSNQLIQQAPTDPKTPIFTAEIGDNVRFRLTHPFGTGTSQVFTLHGHAWQRNPYTNNSTAIGNNSLSQWLGSRDNHGSTDHADIVVDKAGGEFGRAGDYLYTVFVQNQANQGSWGLFRVGPPNLHMQQPRNSACVPVTQPGYVPPTPNKDVERFIRKPLNPGGKP